MIASFRHSGFAAVPSIKKTGAELRAMMPWIGANKLVDKVKK